MCIDLCCMLQMSASCYVHCVQLQKQVCITPVAGIIGGDCISLAVLTLGKKDSTHLSTAREVQ